jgi:hypothetical protein
MGNKVGGAFKALIGAAVKYNLVSYSKGQIKTEPFYQDYKLAYSEDQKAEAPRRAFLNVPLFKQLATRLGGKQLPEAYFEKLMMKEYQVPQETSPEHLRTSTEWWARSDSNRGPRDSLDPAVSGGSGLSLHPLRRKGVRDALACH